MTNTIPTKNFAEAIVIFQSLMGSIELNADVKVSTKSGGTYTFSYATLGQVKEAIRENMAKVGLGYIQKDKDGFIETHLIHVSGEREISTLRFNPIYQTAQEFGSWITYMRRYALVLALGLVAEDDEDGNIASGNTAIKTENKPYWKTAGVHKTTGEPMISGKYNGREWFARLAEDGTRIYYKDAKDGSTVAKSLWLNDMKLDNKLDELNF